MKLSELARQLKCELKGNGSVEIHGVAGIEEAGPSELTFVSNPKYLRKISSSQAGAIILEPGAPPTCIPTLLSENPYLTFAKAIELFYAPPVPIPGIHPTACVSGMAEVEEGGSIGAHVVISEGVRIGRNAILHPHVVIYPYAEIGDDFVAHSHAVVREYCRIGNRVILQNGAVIGADGFGFAPREDKSYYKIMQSGTVVVEDDVEIGAHTCVDRATVGETRIREGAKIDNLVQIGHGSLVGRRTLLAAQVGLAGSSRLGENVLLAGQVGVAGHLTIGDRVQVIAQSGIGRSVDPDKKIAGSPEMDASLWKKNYLLMHEFPQIVRTLRKLQVRVDELEAQLTRAPVSTPGSRADS